MKIAILEPQDFSEEAIAKLRLLGEVYKFDNSLNLNHFIKDKDILFIRLKYMIDSKFLETADSLKVICSPTTGLTHLDESIIKNKRIKLLTLKGEVKFLKRITSTIEHTLGLVISLLRLYNEIFSIQEIKEFNRELYKGFTVKGLRIGIIGYGRIGKILAKYLITMGGIVSFYDIKNFKSTKNIKRINSIESLIETNEMILLTASYNLENYHLFSKNLLLKLQNKWFINISRGEFIDEVFLINNFKKIKLRGIALDVYQNEQGLNNIPRFLKLKKQFKNIILTPHIGGATISSMHETELFLVDKLIKIFS